MAVLEVDDISIRFGGLQALGNVSVKAQELEIVGLIGPNGAGKTTLFNCVTGFYRPNEGRVRFLGQDVTEVAIHERAAMGMGRTFQQVGLVKGATVLENVITAQHTKIDYGATAGMLGVPATWASEREFHRRGMEILDLVGLAHLAEHRVAGLPYGTMKNVEMAAVLATDPEILMLDEPTSGMGPEESHAFGDVLLRLRKELGLTVLMIEHHVPLVVAVCDYVYCLNFGQLLAEGKPEAVRSHPEVIVAYLGEEAEEVA
ncbi:MAG TPA: ABC transporter ATP-binding protein [Acidimicrobiales bacterium]|nr:ABC transporter ATP-binding protein [Acidimicrobiales bacterium]